MSFTRPARDVVTFSTGLLMYNPDDRLHAEAERVRRLDLLIARLPEKLQRLIRWLLAPGRAWIRVPAGLLFMLGGCLAFLPVLGLWMLPLGFFLLSEDIAFMRHLSGRLLAWIEHRHPRWMGLQGP